MCVSVCVYNVHVTMSTKRVCVCVCVCVCVRVCVRARARARVCVVCVLSRGTTNVANCLLNLGLFPGPGKVRFQECPTLPAT